MSNKWYWTKSGMEWKGCETKHYIHMIVVAIVKWNWYKHKINKYWECPIVARIKLYTINTLNTELRTRLNKTGNTGIENCDSIKRLTLKWNVKKTKPPVSIVWMSVILAWSLYYPEYQKIQRPDITGSTLGWKALNNK